MAEVHFVVPWQMLAELIGSPLPYQDLKNHLLYLKEIRKITNEIIFYLHWKNNFTKYFLVKYLSKNVL